MVSALFGIGLFWSFCNPGDVHTDGGIFSAVAFKCLHGGQLYVDAWENKPPGIFLINELFLLLIPNPVYALFTLSTLAMATLSICVFRIGYMGLRSLLAALLFLLASVPLIVYKNNVGDGLYTEVFGTCFIMISLVLYMKNRQIPDNRTLITGLVFAGSAPWLKEPFALISFAILTLYLVQFKSQLSLLKKTLFFLSPSVAMLTYLILSGSLMAFIETLKYNFSFTNDPNSEPMTEKLMQIWSLLIRPGLAIFILNVFVTALNLKDRKRRKESLIIMMILAAAIGFVMIFPHSFGHYYLPVFAILPISFAMQTGIAEENALSVKWPFVIAALFTMNNIDNSNSLGLNFKPQPYTEDKFVRRLKSDPKATLFVDYTEKSGYYIKAGKIHPAFMPVGISGHFEKPGYRENNLKKMWEALSTQKPDYLITTYTTAAFSWSLPDTRFYEHNYHKIDSITTEIHQPLYLWKRNQ